MVDLGTLKRIDARKVWTHEAHEFTPWLKEHIALLGAALGLDLDLVESEVAVGPFSADLVAKDVSNDRWVVIENQLEPTDHSHLGQLLTYGAGTEAAVFVWISPDFREEHRAALDWLNEHSDEDSLFFGVVVELIAVDESRPAPSFRLVSFPNEWQKTTRASRAPNTGKGATYAEFFSGLLGDFKRRHPGETNVSKGHPQNWLSLSIGKSGVWTHWAFTGDMRFRIALEIDTGDYDRNHDYFQQVASQRSRIEELVGHELEWDRVEGRQACRIYSYYHHSPITVEASQTELEDLRQWAVDEMKRVRDAVRPFIQALDLAASEPAVGGTNNA